MKGLCSYQRAYTRFDLFQSTFGEDTTASPQCDKTEFSSHFKTDQLANVRSTTNVHHSLQFVAVFVSRVGRQVKITNVLQALDVHCRFGHFVFIQQMLDNVLLGIEATQTAHDDGLLKRLLCNGTVTPSISKLGLLVFLEYGYNLC